MGNAESVSVSGEVHRGSTSSTSGTSSSGSGSVPTTADTALPPHQHSEESTANSHFDISVNGNRAVYGAPMTVYIKPRVGAKFRLISRWYVDRLMGCGTSQSLKCIDSQCVCKEVVEGGSGGETVYVAHFSPVYPTTLGVCIPTTTTTTTATTTSGSSTFVGDSSGATRQDDTYMTLRLYTGNWFTKGTLQCSAHIKVGNPLRSFRADVVEDHQQRRIRCSYTLAVPRTPLAKGSICLRHCGGGCVDRVPFRVLLGQPAQCGEEETILLLHPRLNGKYEVDVCYGATEEAVVMRHSIEVVTARSDFHLHVERAGGASTNEALCVNTGAPLTVCCGPTQALHFSSDLETRDVVEIVKVDSLGNVAHSSEAVYVPAAPHRLTAQNFKKLTVRAPQQPGVYAVVIGLHHENGRYLPVAKTLVMCVKPPEQPTASLCCVCLDNQKTIKLDPCKHVVLCNQCFRDLQRTSVGGLKCPMCRTRMTKYEQVFLC